MAQPRTARGSFLGVAPDDTTYGTAAGTLTTSGGRTTIAASRSKYQTRYSETTQRYSAHRPARTPESSCNSSRRGRSVTASTTTTTGCIDVSCNGN